MHARAVGSQGQGAADPLPSAGRASSNHLRPRIVGHRRAVPDGGQLGLALALQPGICRPHALRLLQQGEEQERSRQFRACEEVGGHLRMAPDST